MSDTHLSNPPTMWNIIHHAARGVAVSETWDGIPEYSKRKLVREVLVQLRALARLTHWDVRDIPDKLGCTYHNLDLREVSDDTLADCVLFLANLVELTDWAAAQGPPPPQKISTATARLAIFACGRLRRLGHDTPLPITLALIESADGGHAAILKRTATLQDHIDQQRQQLNESLVFGLGSSSLLPISLVHGSPLQAVIANPDSVDSVMRTTAEAARAFDRRSLN